MVGSPFAFGSTLTPTQQAPWGPTSSYSLLQPTLPSGGYGFAPQAPIQSAQQILQWLHLLPQQLQQLTYLQQQTLQQLLQVLPAQHQQLQQVVQLVPYLIHQLQQLQAFPAGTPSIYAAQPSHVM